MDVLHFAKQLYISVDFGFQSFGLLAFLIKLL